MYSKHLGHLYTTSRTRRATIYTLNIWDTYTQHQELCVLRYIPLTFGTPIHSIKNYACFHMYSKHLGHLYTTSRTRRATIYTLNIWDTYTLHQELCVLPYIPLTFGTPIHSIKNYACYHMYSKHLGHLYTTSRTRRATIYTLNIWDTYTQHQELGVLRNIPLTFGTPIHSIKNYACYHMYSKHLGHLYTTSRTRRATIYTLNIWDTYTQHQELCVLRYIP